MKFCISVFDIGHTVERKRRTHAYRVFDSYPKCIIYQPLFSFLIMLKRCVFLICYRFKETRISNDPCFGTSKSIHNRRKYDVVASTH